MQLEMPLISYWLVGRRGPKSSLLALQTHGAWMTTPPAWLELKQLVATCMRLAAAVPLTAACSAHPVDIIMAMWHGDHGQPVRIQTFEPCNPV